jgi:DNA-binding LytR/AlgR family response regulator
MTGALVIEDERLSADRLVSMIGKTGRRIEILEVLDSGKKAAEWLRDNSPPDLIFLDIQLGDQTAFDLLKETSVTSPIIFTTAYDEYAVKAFEYNSVDYLLKPIQLEKLASALDKFEGIGNRNLKTSRPEANYESVQRIISGEFKKRFLVKLGDQYVPVDVTEIAYIYYEEGTAWIYTHQGKKYLIDHTLEQLDHLLNPLEFFRINRQFIITLKSIQEIHTYLNSRLLIRLAPSRDEEVIVSRDRVSDFKRWMDL